MTTRCDYCAAGIDDEPWEYENAMAACITCMTQMLIQDLQGYIQESDQAAESFFQQGNLRAWNECMAMRAKEARLLNTLRSLPDDEDEAATLVGRVWLNLGTMYEKAGETP